MKTLPLTPDVLVAAYMQGVFPMDVEGTIQWFSPNPRAILPLEEFKVSRSLRQVVRSGRFEVRINTCFDEVIRSCSQRPDGTWISSEIIQAYTRLHRLGIAHCVETWRGGSLAGGLYGVAIGAAFFGESMFHRCTDASKAALVALVERMRLRGFVLLDVQFLTDHLERFGAIEIPRRLYLARLKKALEIETTFTETT